MRSRVAIFAGVLLAVTLSSCQWLSSLVHDGEVVAKLGGHKLYRSDLEAIIPSSASPEDSANMAALYINSWATDMAFQDLAAEELSKEEKDVSKELEEYRQNLLRYRYEQRYVNERLDTTVTEEQVQEYYAAHKESFKVDRPLVKARFLNIDKKSKSLPKLRKLMSSNDIGDMAVADSIAFSSTSHYHDFSSKWIDIVTLAAEFGMSYQEVLAHKNGSVIEIPAGDKVSLAYVVDMVGAGSVAPIDYCRETIRDNIVSGRKHELLSTLERDLLESAKVKENFVIISR